MGNLNKKRFLDDFNEFSRWLDRRVQKGTLKKLSAVVQKSVVKNFLLQLEEAGIEDYTEGYLLPLTRIHKDDVVRRFVSFANSKRLIGKQVRTPFGLGTVLDRLVIDSPEIFLKVKLDSGTLVIIPYNLAEEV